MDDTVGRDPDGLHDDAGSEPRTGAARSRWQRLVAAVRLPPAYEGPILSGRIDGFAYLVGWVATFAHVALAASVLLLGLHRPWPTVSTVTSTLGTIFFLSIVIAVHRRVGESKTLPRAVVWQWWLGPWDPVGRLVWLPVRLPEATRALAGGARVPTPTDEPDASEVPPAPDPG